MNLLIQLIIDFILFYKTNVQQLSFLWKHVRTFYIFYNESTKIGCSCKVGIMATSHVKLKVLEEQKYLEIAKEASL